MHNADLMANMTHAIKRNQGEVWIRGQKRKELFLSSLHGRLIDTSTPMVICFKSEIFAEGRTSGFLERGRSGCTWREVPLHMRLWDPLLYNNAGSQKYLLRSRDRRDHFYWVGGSVHVSISNLNVNNGSSLWALNMTNVGVRNTCDHYPLTEFSWTAW